MVWIAINLLAFLLCCQQVLALECYYCHSYYSWQDCDKHLQPDNCSSKLNTCYTSHRVQTYSSGKQVHDFLRSCFHTDYCTSEECNAVEDDRVTGSWCEFECCNTTFCNHVVTQWAKKRGFVMMELAIDEPSGMTTVVANQWSLSSSMLFWMLMHEIT